MTNAQALVTNARAWALRLGRGRTAEMLIGLADALDRKAPGTTREIPGAYEHTAKRLEEIGQRIGGGDGKLCETGALFIRELAAEVFQGIRGPA